MRAESQPTSAEQPTVLPALRFDVNEAAAILRISRAQLYVRIQQGAIKVQKDGSRTYVSRPELERYVAQCDRLVDTNRCDRAPDS